MTVDFDELAGWAAGSSPLYADLCAIVAADEDLLALADHVPEGRSRANVFVAALQYLVQQGVDHPLAEYFASVRAEPREPDDELAATLRDFCQTYESDLVPLLENRRTQTNAVRRCAALYPAFCHVESAIDGDGPIAIVELGPSAGLNLLWDRYRYDYDGRVVGAATSPVTIETSVRGETEPPLANEPPAVHSRVGVDIHPMDVTDADETDWLQALVWPEQRERRRALEGAIEVAREDPPRIVAGDMVEELPGLLAEIPEEVPVVVYSTLVLYQVPDAVRGALTDVLETAMAERSLHWLSGDGVYGDSEGITLEWTRWEAGGPRTDLLAAFEQHGDWIEWRPDPALVEEWA